MLQALNRWHKTKLGLLVFGLVELALAYGLASMSINNGNLWYYLLTLILLVGSLRNLFTLIGSFFHAPHGKAKKA